MKKTLFCTVQHVVRVQSTGKSGVHILSLICGFYQRKPKNDHVLLATNGYFIARVDILEKQKCVCQIRCTVLSLAILNTFANWRQVCDSQRPVRARLATKTHLPPVHPVQQPLSSFLLSTLTHHHAVETLQPPPHSTVK